MLHLDHVSVRFNGTELPAVDDVSLRVEAGERVALIGPSGAGKSSMLRLASGLLLPSAGSVTTLGVSTHHIGRRTHRETRRHIGIVTQDFALVGPLRVANNVAAGRLGQWSWWRSLRSLIRPSPIDEIAAALDRFGIADKIWERADQLSGGQQQRTALARIVFQAPDLLLADEPVSALDPARSDSVMAELALAASRPGQALIASMHDAELALRHCNRIVAMRDGRIRFDLPPSDVTDDLLTSLYALDDVADR